MKKRIGLLFIAVVAFVSSFAGHISGGELFYEYIGPGAGANTDQYRFTLRLFRECNPVGNAAELDASVKVGVFRRSDNSMFGNILTINRTRREVISLGSFSPCIVNPPEVCYQVGYYIFVVDLPRESAGYSVLFQRCCRSNNITNLASPSNDIGASYLATIPGSNTPGLTSGFNSSPQFVVKDTALVCQNRRFSLDFGATDPDGDSLSYSFCETYTGGSSGASTPDPNINAYGPVPYSFPYSGGSPLGIDVTINPRTGIISGKAPPGGKYVICVCVSEWRNGEIINVHRKDFLLSVAACDFAAAELPISQITCDGFNVTFQNLSNSPLINSYFWDFGVLSQTGDTSIQAVPTFVYPDSGVYLIKLVVNKGQECSDSTTTKAFVYPGFFPGFDVVGSCINTPFRFIDTSRTRYGVINNWRWDFGESTLASDTSRLQNPTYLYPTVGIKRVEFIVQSDKGCTDTLYKDVEVRDKPVITLPFRDTLICNIDTLQLQSSGLGVSSWGPQVNIINPNTATPLVFPRSTTTYVLTLNDNNCINRDSVRVRVVSQVTVNAGRDTVICQGDPVQLNASSDGTNLIWNNPGTLNNPTVLNPFATPLATTNYTLTATIGGCRATDVVNVKVVPYPGARAGNDTIICFSTSAQLNANITGSAFRWFPSTYLNNPNILNPVSTPPGTIRYILTVTDTLGCPKPGRDTITVTMLPKVVAFAGNDTTIVAGQPLQLFATGGTIFQWTPPTGLTNPNIANPIALLNASIDSIRYMVRVSTIQGCTDSAFLRVKIFKTSPDVFVPTAFSPNGDGINDVFRPIPVGISKLEYFRVFNRWGQMVFSTPDIGRGWDGSIGGKAQGSDAFVWLVKAVDFTGKTIFKKGSVLLIR
jgi:gliding motility-associated-like protein